MNVTEYHIEVEIRINGKIPIGSDGRKVTSIKSIAKINERFLENHMVEAFIEFNAITPINTDINVYAYLPNTIANTMMCMASFYGSEKRFVKH